MAASSFLDVCRFNPTLAGTTDWTYSSAVQGYQSPSAAGAVNGAQFSYRAESADLSQWEVGTGVYNSSTGVITRATVLFNSAGTTAKISFSSVPQVALVALAEDLFPRVGTTAGGNAAAGEVGEYVTATRASGSPISLASGTATDVISISLSAGDWDVYGTVLLVASGTLALVTSWINTTSAVLPSLPDTSVTRYTSSSTGTESVPSGTARISLSTTTTVFLSTQTLFSSGTTTAAGIIAARRRR